MQQMQQAKLLKMLGIMDTTEQILSELPSGILTGCTTPSGTDEHFKWERI
jgi:hypothetical protein